MKLSEIRKPDHSEILHAAHIGPAIHHVSTETLRDEYRGMKVYQFEMNAFEMSVAKAAIHALHQHHNEFYELEKLTGGSIGNVFHDCIMIGLNENLKIKKMMEEMVEDDMF